MSIRVVCRITNCAFANSSSPPTTSRSAAESGTRTRGEGAAPRGTPGPGGDATRTRAPGAGEQHHLNALSALAATRSRQAPTGFDCNWRMSTRDHRVDYRRRTSARATSTSSPMSARSGLRHQGRHDPTARSAGSGPGAVRRVRPLQLRRSRLVLLAGRGRHRSYDAPAPRGPSGQPGQLPARVLLRHAYRGPQPTSSTLTGEILEFTELPEAIEYQQSENEAAALLGASGGSAHGTGRARPRRWPSSKAAVVPGVAAVAQCLVFRYD